MIGIARLMAGPASRGAIFETGALLDEEIGDIAIERRMIFSASTQWVPAWRMVAAIFFRQPMASMVTMAPFNVSSVRSSGMAVILMCVVSG